MAKASKKQHTTGINITTPSQFGSHASMVVGEADTEGMVVCKDDRGEYITFANRLDNGLADPRRYGRTE